MMRIAVVGLGKVGLPLAVAFAANGHEVRGCDRDPAVVAAVNAGRSPLTGEAELPERLAEAVHAGRLCATSDTTAAVAASNAVVVIVPVLVDARGAVDYQAVDAATDDIGRGLRPGVLVVYETTLPTGTTRERLGPRLAARSGLEPGRDFALAFSPERVFSGRIFRDLRAYPKIVGGVDAESTRRAGTFYREALGAEVLTVRDAETAELAKLVETTYRDVNIALANEFARFAAARGIDALEAIAAANTQPYSHVHQPGVGVGGHCIPVYPHFLIGAAEGGMTLPRAARAVNDGMAGYAADLLAGALGGLGGTTVLILGLAYRGDVKEAAFSSTHLLAAALRAAGARVLVHDPLFTDDEIRGRGYEPATLAPPPAVDALVLQAAHRAYMDLDFAAFAGCRIVLDGRNALAPERVHAAGMRYIGIGRPA
jgi:nucleotide sugar dehydrogenase